MIFHCQEERDRQQQIKEEKGQRYTRVNGKGHPFHPEQKSLTAFVYFSPFNSTNGFWSQERMKSTRSWGRKGCAVWLVSRVVLPVKNDPSQRKERRTSTKNCGTKGEEETLYDLTWQLLMNVWKEYNLLLSLWWRHQRMVQNYGPSRPLCPCEINNWSPIYLTLSFSQNNRVIVFEHTAIFLLSHP